MIDTIRQYLLAAWQYPGVSWIVLAVILDLVSALAVAFKTATFSFAALGEFLTQKLLPYVIVYIGCSLIGDAVGLGAVGNATFVVIQAMLLASIIDNLQKIGVPIPPAIVALVQPRETTVTLVEDVTPKP